MSAYQRQNGRSGLRRLVAWTIGPQTAYSFVARDYSGHPELPMVQAFISAPWIERTAV